MIRILTIKDSSYYEALKYVEAGANEWLEGFNPDTIRNVSSQLTEHQEVAEGQVKWTITLVITVTMEP